MLKNKLKTDNVCLSYIAELSCSLIGNLIWEKGILDYIYLKPLYI